MEDIIIRKETEKDYRATEELTRDAFWNVYRPGCLEHFVLHNYRSREDFLPELDFVMEKEGRIIGHIMYARAEIILADGKLPIATFGPLSIAKDMQKKGYGAELARYSMEKAKDAGFGAVAITGDIGFYGRLGFVVAKNVGIKYAPDPEAEYFLIKELKEGYLDGIIGTYEDLDGYTVDEKEAELFDAGFPFREKHSGKLM